MTIHPAKNREFETLLYKHTLARAQRNRLVLGQAKNCSTLHHSSREGTARAARPLHPDDRADCKLADMSLRLRGPKGKLGRFAVYNRGLLSDTGFLMPA